MRILSNCILLLRIFFSDLTRDRSLDVRLGMEPSFSPCRATCAVSSPYVAFVSIRAKRRPMSPSSPYGLSVALCRLRLHTGSGFGYVLALRVCAHTPSPLGGHRVPCNRPASEVLCRRSDRAVGAKLWRAQRAEMMYHAASVTVRLSTRVLPRFARERHRCAAGSFPPADRATRALKGNGD